MAIKAPHSEAPSKAVRGARARRQNGRKRNLLENAVKYLAPGRPGKIVVSGALEGLFYRYTIVDNGRGISSKYFERIFDLFRRPGEQNTPGEGIGLAYVRNLVRRLGGSISVSSELGTGSSFTVTLPVSFVVITGIDAQQYLSSGALR